MAIALTTWKTAHPKAAAIAPDWVQQLVLAADQFVVARPLPDDPSGKSIIAGYHWFADWGRDNLAVFQDKSQANYFLTPMAHHICTAGLGTISEIFNGDAPMLPKGCIAQAWSVGEVLRAWMSMNGGD